MGNALLISDQLENATGEDFIAIKNEARKNARANQSFIVSEINRIFGVNLTLSDYIYYVEARYSNLPRVPTTPQQMEQFRYNSGVLSQFTGKYGQQIILFIDSIAAGGNTDQAEQRVLDFNKTSFDMLKNQVTDFDKLEYEVNQVLAGRRPDEIKSKLVVKDLKAKLQTGQLEFASENYQANYFSIMGDYPESGEYPTYRDLMLFKKYLVFQRGVSFSKFPISYGDAINYIVSFENKYPRTAKNIQNSININRFKDNPVWLATARQNITVLESEVREWSLEEDAILEAQDKMSEFEVYAFNSRLALVFQDRDQKLAQNYYLRDQMEKEQVKLIVTFFQKSEDTQKKRNESLKNFLLDVKVRNEVYKPYFLKYAEILEKDLQTRQRQLDIVVSVSLQRILDEIFPPAFKYFTPDGKYKFPKALNVMEEIPFPTGVALDNAYKMVQGWGTPIYAEARFNEFQNLIEELKRKNEEYFGKVKMEIRKGYFKIYVKPSRPSFPFIGPQITRIDDRKYWISETEKPGFMFIESIGFINFAKLPNPITLAFDIGVDWRLKTLKEKEYERAVQQKLWEEKQSRTLIGRFQNFVQQAAYDFGSVVKELNPYSLIHNGLKSNPITGHVYNELDKLTGNTLSGINTVVKLPTRVLRGEPIKKEDILKAVELALKAGIIVASGGSAGAIIGVAAGQLKQGTIGKDEFGRKLLGAVEIAGYVWSAGDAITKQAREKGLELTQEQLVKEAVKDYGTRQARGVVQTEVLKKTGLDKTTLGLQFGIAVFSTVGPGATNNFSTKGIVGSAITETAKSEAAKFVEEKTGGIVKGSYVQKAVGNLLPQETLTAKDKSYTESIGESALSKVELYKQKARVMNMLSKGKIPSIKDLRLVHPEAEYFLKELKEYVPEAQLGEGLNMALNIGLPKFNLPNFGLPNISLPDFRIPNFLNVKLPSVDLPNVAKFNVPDLPKLGISVPKIELPDMPTVKIPSPDFKLPSVDLKNIIKHMIPKGLPLYTGMNIDPYYFNLMDLDGAVIIRPELQFSPFEHAMLRYGVIPRHLTRAQINYMKARELEYKNAILKLEQIEKEQERILTEIFTKV